MKAVIRKLLNCSRGGCSWRYGYHDFNTIEGRLKYLFWTKVEYWRDRPRCWRIHWGNRLAMWAARIRGDKLYDLGYGIEGNLAAMLEDSIRHELLLARIRDGCSEYQIDRYEDTMRDVEILAGLAKANSFLDYEKFVRENQ